MKNRVILCEQHQISLEYWFKVILMVLSHFYVVPQSSETINLRCSPTANGIPTTIGVTCVSTRILRAVNVCDTYTKVELQVQ